jgi:hypothetical protein
VIQNKNLRSPVKHPATEDSSGYLLRVLSFWPQRGTAVAVLQFAHCQAALQFRIRLRCDKAGKQDGDAGNKFAEKRLFSSTGTEGAFYEGYLGYTNGGSSRYVVFDYVAYGGAQL